MILGSTSPSQHRTMLVRRRFALRSLVGTVGSIPDKSIQVHHFPLHKSCIQTRITRQSYRSCAPEGKQEVQLRFVTAITFGTIMTEYPATMHWSGISSTRTIEGPLQDLVLGLGTVSSSTIINIAADAVWRR